MNSVLKTVMLSAAFLATSASADDLGKSKQILCSAINVNVCQSDGVCAAALPADRNIPQFIEVGTGPASCRPQPPAAKTVKRRPARLSVRMTIY